MSAWAQVTSAILTLAGDGAKLMSHAERPWWSATFQGTRHSLHLGFDGEEAVLIGEAFIAELPEHDFELAGHKVAEAKIVWVHRTNAPHLALQVDLLLLDERKAA